MADKYPVENEDLKEIILFFRDCALGEFDGTNKYGHKAPESVEELLKILENMGGKELYFEILNKEKGTPLAYMASVHIFLEKYDSKWEKEILGKKYKALEKKYPSTKNS